ncbi:hypothetical protein D3C72_580450 [compost metagenome]
MVADAVGGKSAWAALTRGRLAHLQALGLAERQGRRFRLDENLESKLRRLQISKDVIRTLNQRRLETGRTAEVFREGRVTGKVMKAGFHDELGVSPFAVVRDAQGVEHYARLGMWSAEDINGDVDLVTGQLIGERRTDIVYGWTPPGQGVELIFEFKRLGRQKKHRDHYLGSNGLQRFVTGFYGADQAVAAMVGVLLDPKEEVVPNIQTALEDPAVAATLNIRATPSGQSCDCPSPLFTAAEFDTDHDRPTINAGMASIRVSHLFLQFGYPVSTVKPKKPKVAK